jgi:hypothetical protein
MAHKSSGLTFGLKGRVPASEAPLVNGPLEAEHQACSAQ